MNSSANNLTIGAVAEAAGVNVETIRFYQRRACCQNLTSPTAASGVMGIQISSA